MRARSRIAVGGNFDADSVESFPALLDFLKEQDFADKLVKVAFKPVVRERQAPKNVIPLTRRHGQAAERHVHDGRRLGRLEHLRHLPVRRRAAVHLREETKKRGFPTVDGVHMGPCEIHKRHAYTVGPNGSHLRLPRVYG